jgi:hypothetical protein
LQKALQLEPKNGAIPYNLALAKRDLGKFAEALDDMERSRELLPPGSGMLPIVRRGIVATTHLIDLKRKLAVVRSEHFRPGDVAECLELARFCLQPYQRQCATACRLYAEAFEAQPAAADDLRQQHRYNAACAAALAAAGKDKDVAKPEAKERARLRQQARDWLRADLDLWAKLLDGKSSQVGRDQVPQTLHHWQEDTDLIGVRDETALANLSDEERAMWRRLWADVGSVLKRAQGQD